MDPYPVLLVFVFLGLTGAQQYQSTNPKSKVDVYSALVQVSIHCRNDPVNGLVCSAEYPDHCKEQWNFPNPCTQNNIDMNVTKFVHPFDKTKFLMCGQLGKLYIVQCPQYEVFHEGCGQCIGERAGLTASCGEVPYPPVNNNPCTREAILANKLFFPFYGNLSQFIHCDIWGKPWERICTPGEVWSIWDVTCVLPHLLNPCNRPTTDINYLYGHPCDPAKYLTCDTQGRAHEINCARGEAFDEKTQRCQEYRYFKDRILSSYCENYVFGFRQFHGKDGVAIGDTVLGNSGSSIGTISGQGFQRDNKGFTIDRSTRTADGSVSVVRDASGQGLNIDLDLRGAQIDRQTDLQGQGGGTAAFDRSTQVRGGAISGQLNTDGQGQIDGSLNVKKGSLSGTSSGFIGVEQGLNSGSTANLVDIRGKSSGPGTSEFIDIRNLGTGGNSANMIDIREEKGIGIRGGQTTGTRKMVDIRGGTAGSGGMSDIRYPNTGTGGNNRVDIRGGQTTGTIKMVDIRGGTAGSGGMTDIRYPNTGTGGNNRVDIRGGQATGTRKMVDIRGGTTGSGGMTDIRYPNTGTGGNNRVDIRGGQTTGTRKMVDIRGGTTGSGGMTDIRYPETGLLGAVDISGKQSSNFVDSRATRTETGISGDGTGSIGIVGIGGSRTDVSGTQIGTSDGRMVDIRNIGSRSDGLVDKGADKTSLSSNFIDSRSGAGDGGFVSGQTSSSQLTGIRTQQNQGSLTTGNQNGISGISSFDIRNQLGLNGIAGTENVDATGTINTETISVSGSVDSFGQGGQGSGTMNELLNTWNQIIGTGSAGSDSSRRDSLVRTGMNQARNGNILDSSRRIHPSRLRMYDYSDIPFNEPCTQENIDRGRTHFRYNGFPHKFLQCDESGRMHSMNCSQTDWFDVYTNTCVDGPIHVDNRVQ